MLILIAAWHAVDAAMRDCSQSIEIAWFSRSTPSRISSEQPFGISARNSSGCCVDRHAARANGRNFKSIGEQFVRDLAENHFLARRKVHHMRHEHALPADLSFAARAQVLLEQDAFVRHVLVDDPEALAIDRDDEARIDLAREASAWPGFPPMHALSTSCRAAAGLKAVRQSRRAARSRPIESAESKRKRCSSGRNGALLSSNPPSEIAGAADASSGTAMRRNHRARNSRWPQAFLCSARGSTAADPPKPPEDK